MTSTRQKGIFHCPRCGPQRQFSLKAVQRYFTLYFIPLIPLGKAGEYIECMQCAGTFGPEVMSYNPAAARQQTIDEIKRVLYAVVTSAGPLTDERLRKLQDTLARVAGLKGELEDLRQALAGMAGARTPLSVQLRGVSSSLSDEGRAILLFESYRILADNGRLMPAAHTCFRELAAAFGITGTYFDQTIRTLREKIQARAES